MGSRSRQFQQRSRRSRARRSRSRGSQDSGSVSRLSNASSDSEDSEKSASETSRAGQRKDRKGNAGFLLGQGRDGRVRRGKKHSAESVTVTDDMLAKVETGLLEQAQEIDKLVEEKLELFLQQREAMIKRECEIKRVNLIKKMKRTFEDHAQSLKLQQQERQGVDDIIAANLRKIQNAT